LQPRELVTISRALYKLSTTPLFENRAELLSVELLTLFIIQLFVKLEIGSLFFAFEVLVNTTVLGPQLSLVIAVNPACGLG
jgi:hypothetical protein